MKSTSPPTRCRWWLARSSVNLRDNNSIHISRSIKSLSHRVIQTREELLKENHREPNLSEIAAAMEMTVEEVVFAFNAAQEPLSLYDPVFHDSTDPVYVMDLISDQSDSTEKWLENIALQEALDKLGPREKQIIEARFFEGKTQVEIARQVGISQAQVSRIEKSGSGDDPPPLQTGASPGGSPG